MFGATGSARPTLSTPSGVRPASSRALGNSQVDHDDEFPVEQFNAFVHDEENSDDEQHLHDM